MSDSEGGIDWNELRLANINLAECIWSYHQALVNAGFEKEHALALTVAFQLHMLTSGMN